MDYLHMVAHVRDRRLDLSVHEEATRLWAGLRRAFPDVVAAMLMPDHIHLLIAALAAGLAQGRLSRCLAGFSWGRGRYLWQAVPEPEHVRGRKKMRRTWRYIALNPCRDGLTDDPLAWTWSTYRDALGAAVDPWVTLQGLRSSCRDPLFSAPQGVHGYVSADPSVDVAGTRAPIAPEPSAIPSCSLDTVASAVAGALRTPWNEALQMPLGRRLFVALAHRQGWRDAAHLATALCVTKRTIRTLRTQPSAGLDAAALCLGDPRLLRGFESTPSSSDRSSDSIRMPDRTRLSWWKTS